MSDKLTRAIADLRADLARDKGGLVRVFADQLEAVLDALEDKPDLVVKVDPKIVVSVPKEEDTFDIGDLYASFKDYNGLWLLGLTVKATKKVTAYPSIEAGTEGMVVGYNHNSRYIYRVKFDAYYNPVNMAHDEIEL